MKKLISIILAVLTIVPSMVLVSHAADKVVLDDIVVGVNERYIGAGYEDKIASEFENYLSKAGYSCNIEYRTLGNKSTSIKKLGSIINSAGDIDFILGAGSNINTTAGVKILTKKLHKSKYNYDGKRYGALLTKETAAGHLYRFLTGGCYHLYDNACDAKCNICGRTRTVKDHTYSSGRDTTCNSCGKVRKVKKFENIVVGVNQRYIGSGYKKTISNAFKTYTTTKGYAFNIEYRTLGDSTTTPKELGKIINSAGDIDLVLGAGSNINTVVGVDIITKSLHKSEYSCDGKRYGALLTDKTSAVLFYHFLTDSCYHVYDNACDNKCNVCGSIRIVSTHACGTTCKVCGTKNTASAHVYSNDCDAICNICGVKRNVGEHVYSDACDTICNVCDFERNVGAHIYSSDKDTKCNECGNKRMVVVVGINVRQIGSGYAKKIEADFEEYAAEMGLEISVIYRNIGNKSTSVKRLGTLVKSEGDIDVLLAAGSNVDSSSGSALKIVEKAPHVPHYNADGSRYAARLTKTSAAIKFYDFVTGDCNISPNRSKTKTKNILFIGNSFTFYNKMPEKYFASICKEGGYKVNVTSITKGKHSLYKFANSKDTYGAKVHAALKNKKYDIVIIQEQSNGSLSNPERFKQGVRDLAEMVKENGAELYLYSTWGYKKGYSLLKDFGRKTSVMEMNVRKAYTEIAKEVDAKLVYAGVAMLDVYENTSIEVYKSDLYHPSANGSLLVAYTFYATIFGEDPRAMSYTAGLNSKNVVKLRKAAFEAAFYDHSVDN